MRIGNWKLKRDGWHKTSTGTTPGNAPFNRPEPVVRDNAGRPLRSDRVSIDTAKWVEEVNEGKWPPK